MRRPGHVLLCSDDNGFHQLKVAVYSLLKTADAARPLRVSVFTGNGALSGGHRVELRALAARYPFANLEIIDVDELLERHRAAFECPSSPWGIMIWARCFIGEVFPNGDGNVVYLDIDTLVCRDLAELYDLEMGSNAIAGVYEDAREDGKNPRFWNGPLMPPEANRYFNSGVLVLNLGVFRREGVLGRLAAWYAQNKAIAERPDQDALNAVFWNRTVRLHPAYNYSDGWCERQLRYSKRRPQWRGNPPREMLEAIVSPAVIHFWGRSKPWHWNHRAEGWRYAQAMRELGLCEGALPGTTAWGWVVAAAYGAGHVLLRRVAKWRM